MTTAASAPAAASALVTRELVAAWFTEFDAIVTERASWLTDLDAAIGDADHGRIMQRGAAATVRDVDLSAVAGVGPLLAVAGATFGAATGGAGGILFATFFQGLAAALNGRDTAPLEDFADAIAAGVACVQVRGRAELSDKTMVDALLPAAHSLQAAAAERVPLTDALTRASVSATDGRDATFALVARRGRASYLGDRSENHLDPGAATAALLFMSLAAAVGSV